MTVPPAAIVASTRARASFPGRTLDMRTASTGAVLADRLERQLRAAAERVDGVDVAGHLVAECGRPERPRVLARMLGDREIDRLHQGWVGEELQRFCRSGDFGRKICRAGRNPVRTAIGHTDDIASAAVGHQARPETSPRPSRSPAATALRRRVKE